MKGLFITFEGLDGSGKTTQIEALRVNLAQIADVVLLREPGSTPLGEALRDIALNNASEIAPEAEALIFAAARAQIVSRKILPAINKGSIVLCDRFIDSSLAYQGVARNLTIPAVLTANELALRGLMPDLTFYLRVENEVSEQRLSEKQSLDRMESEGAEFMSKVREGFEQAAKLYPNRIICIEASRPKEEISEEIFDIVKVFLEKER